MHDPGQHTGYERALPPGTFKPSGRATPDAASRLTRTGRRLNQAAKRAPTAVSGDTKI